MLKSIAFSAALVLGLSALVAAPPALAQLGKVSRLPGQTQRAPPPTAEERMGKLDQAGRIELLREADRETREAFADYQSALAKAKADGEAPGAESVLAIAAATAPRAALKAVANDLSDAALVQQDASRATRNSFKKFAAALDDQEALAAAAGPDATMAAWGAEAPAPAESAAPPPDQDSGSGGAG
jgi:hypothetical protein